MAAKLPMSEALCECRVGFSGGDFAPMDICGREHGAETFQPSSGVSQKSPWAAFLFMNGSRGGQRGAVSTPDVSLFPESNPEARNTASRWRRGSPGRAGGTSQPVQAASVSCGWCRLFSWSPGRGLCAPGLLVSLSLITSTFSRASSLPSMFQYLTGHPAIRGHLRELRELRGDRLHRHPETMGGEKSFGIFRKLAGVMT